MGGVERHPLIRIAAGVVRHVGAALGVALAVATLAFIAIQTAPGDIALRVAEARYGDRIDFSTAEEIRKAAGFDQPVIVQYARWIGSIATGDLGRSTVTNRPVLGEVLRGIAPTLSIAMLGVGAALLGSLILGVIAGINQGGLFDRLFLGLAAFVSSIPPFLIGVMLVLIFAIRLQWLPAAGKSLPGYFVLPSLTLAIALLPEMSRIVRNSVVRTMQDFYVTYGRVKGQSWLRIIFRHALRPTLVPIVAYFGPLIANMIGGMIIIDVLFNLGGLGSELVQAVLAADIPMALGTGLFIGVLVVVVNGLTDVAVTLLDPRRATKVEAA